MSDGVAGGLASLSRIATVRYCAFLTWSRLGWGLIPSRDQRRSSPLHLASFWVADCVNVVETDVDDDIYGQGGSKYFTQLKSG